ncbi:MAG: polysaccharide pyruvyl transferase family protein [Butyrivibrio sp.]|nr:polysaccharide pyruvyl transferase family protein [Butyrivibrio sp.]
MKIGILTFVNTTNYGAALQSYALQQVLGQQGQDCEIIDYTCENIDRVHDPKKASRKGGIKNLLAPILQVPLQKTYDKFMKFKKIYCRYSIPCDRSTIASVAGKYDRIVVGSDQVWNAVITGDDRSFLLDFLDDDKKKYTYAASIGTGYFTKLKSEYEALINRFQLISIREKGAADQLRKHIGRDDVCVDLDPTLLNRDIWGSLITNDSPYGKYIFCYFLPKDKKLIVAIRRFAKENKCKIINLTKSIRRHKGIHSINVASPIDFLNLIAHAQYVIAGSFHSLCFSLIFHKEFYVVSSPIADRNSRLTDLLDTLELNNRFVMQPDYEFQQEKINYDTVDKKLDAEITCSMETIKKICRSTGKNEK